MAAPPAMTGPGVAVVAAPLGVDVGLVAPGRGSPLGETAAAVNAAGDTPAAAAPGATRSFRSWAATSLLRGSSCRVAVRAGVSELDVSDLTRIVAPSTTAAIANQRRPRGGAGGVTMAPGGTDTELGFCAGVSSLLGERRIPAAGLGPRASRARPDDGAPDRASASASTAVAGVGDVVVVAVIAANAAEDEDGVAPTRVMRATTSAGDSSPICVVVRVACSGAGDAPGRDGTLRGRRE